MAFISGLPPPLPPPPSPLTTDHYSFHSTTALVLARVSSVTNLSPNSRVGQFQISSSSTPGRTDHDPANTRVDSCLALVDVHELAHPSIHPSTLYLSCCVH